MNPIGKPERATQNRIVALFRNALGYRYLGDWSERVNRHIEEGLLRDWLARHGHTPEQISRALDLLGREANNPTRSLYDNNRAVYSLLRYGVPVKTAAGENTETVWLIDWTNPPANDFALAEEVTLKGAHDRRPDLVLYLNGLAIGVIELKRSAVGIGEGMRQLISNQSPEFNAWFFSTVQIVFAGNDSEGLRYGTVGTPEKMFLTWKEDEADNSGYKLDKYLLKLCDKTRLIELLRDFVLFDGGIKKLPRVHQYFGIKAAQRHARDYRGGIIWHTQGSGKSIVMVLLAKWILENLPRARVLIVTDGDDKPYGYIVDYKDLFKKVQGAMAVYTSELDTSEGGASPEILLQDRLTAGRERLEAAREALALLCEPVPPPKGELEHIHYFCGNSEIADDLAAHEPQRIALYKSVAALVRAYASIADNLPEAGYSTADIAAIEQEQTRAVELRETIRKASGETLDLKAHEADMRHLIDTYIKAEEARKISAFGETGLLALIVQSGIAAAIASLPKAIQGNRDAVAEVIANNVRSRIIREHLHDPAFYDSMSRLLAEVLADLKAQRIDYETYLKRIAAVVGQVHAGKADDTPEPLKASPGLRAIYNLLVLASGASTLAAEPAPSPPGSGADEALAVAQRIDATLRTSAPDGWRDVLPKEQEVKRLVYDVVQDTALVERLFAVIKAQTEY